MHAPAPDTRDQILDAAEALFARQGFAGTTIKQIGAEAGVNSALLYYYFRDKEQLYRATLERLAQGLIRRGVERLDAPGPPEARLRAFLEFQADAVASQPNLWPIFLRELVDHSARHAVEQIRLLAATVFRRICDLIAEGQRTGVFRAELDPRFAAIACVSTILHFFTARPAIGIFLGFGTEGPPKDTVRAYARHAADFALAALTAGAAARAPAPRRRPQRRTRSR
ncbi:MAG TPA: TetR/AcrR family transcriptional regulator [Gemmatimonadales bacterium]|nr:TetR/AcrR family transcriptional regulator [Gemmatimonadales bacterium]